MQGAGGVGGLLAATDHSATKTHHAAYDGNGNLTDLMDSSGASVAHYEYDAFGNTTAKSGPEADSNPFRFSTKYLDEETGFYYYGFRHYDSKTGRWPSRDPIEEDGGYNLYGFVYNAPDRYYDYLGNNPVLIAKIVAALTAAIAPVITEVISDKMPLCQKFASREPCQTCCDVAATAGLAVIAIGEAAGLVSCWTSFPLNFGYRSVCITAVTGGAAQGTQNIGEAYSECITLCSSKPSKPQTPKL